MKQWLIAITAVTVFSGIVYILLPNVKTKRTFSVISGIVLLYVFLLPLQSKASGNLFRDFTLDEQELSQSLQAQYDNTVLVAFENGIKEAVDKSLTEKNIETDGLSVECEKKNGEFTVKKITVYIEENSSTVKSQIVKIIRQNIQGEPDIEVIVR